MSWFASSEVQQSKLCLCRWNCRSKGGGKKSLVFLRARCGLPHVLMLAIWACTPILRIAGQAVIQGCGRMQDFPHTLLLRHFATLSSRDRPCTSKYFCLLYRNSGDHEKNSVWTPHHTLTLTPLQVMKMFRWQRPSYHSWWAPESEEWALWLHNFFSLKGVLFVHSIWRRFPSQVLSVSLVFFFNLLCKDPVTCSVETWMFPPSSFSLVKLQRTRNSAKFGAIKLAQNKMISTWGGLKTRL